MAVSCSRTYTWMRPAAGLRLFSKCFCLCCSWTFRAKPEPRMPCTNSEQHRELMKWLLTFTDLQTRSWNCNSKRISPQTSSQTAETSELIHCDTFVMWQIFTCLQSHQSPVNWMLIKSATDFFFFKSVEGWTDVGCLLKAEPDNLKCAERRGTTAAVKHKQTSIYIIGVVTITVAGFWWVNHDSSSCYDNSSYLPVS